MLYTKKTNNYACIQMLRNLLPCRVCVLNDTFINQILVLVWFVALHPSKQLWACRDGQFT